MGCHGQIGSLLVVCLARPNFVDGAFALWVHGYSIFELIKVPEFDPGNEDLKETVGELHGLFANVLLGLSAAHAAMALWHHYVKKDDTLQRMLTKRD